jgi:hypothetical protein
MHRVSKEILSNTKVRTLFNIAHFYLVNAFTRRLSRETFRAAALACTTPFCAARMTNGWAARRAAAAAPGSPAAIASSTLRTQVRIWLRRDRLTSARRSILRTAFLAERVFAIKKHPGYRPTREQHSTMESRPGPLAHEFRNENRLHDLKD